MFQPIKISAKNFLSIGNVPVEFEFQSGLNYIFGINKDLSSDDSEISNGSGKSTICDSMVFALFGRTPRKIKIKDTINMQNKSNCEIEFEFMKEEDHYIIRRGLKPDYVKIEKNGIELSEEATKRNANRYIENEILNGLSFDVFKNLIILNSNTSSSFFEMGKQEKNNFVNQVFSLSFLTYLQSELTADVLTKKNEVNTNEALKEQREKEIERLDKLRHQDLSDLPQKIADTEKTITDLRNEINVIIQNIGVIVGNPEFNEEMIPELQKYVTGLNTKLMNNKTQINNLEYKLCSLRNDYAKMQKEGENVKAQVCHYCGQNLPRDKVQVLLENIQTKLVKLTEEGKNDKETYEKLKEDVTKIEEFINNVNSVLEHYFVKVNLLKDEVTIVDGWKRQIDPETNEHIQKQIDDCKKDYEDFLKKCDENINEYNELKYTRDVVNNKAFYGYYISVFREHLNETIEKYLRRLLSPHIVSFSDDLTADVMDSITHESHSYGNLSTGERAKVNIALLLSLFDSLTNFHRFESTILVLDEVLDTGIDSEGIKLLHEILKEKVEENPKLGIYVVSHKTPQNTFIGEDGIRKITFIKQNGFTELEED